MRSATSGWLARRRAATNPPTKSRMSTAPTAIATIAITDIAASLWERAGAGRLGAGAKARRAALPDGPSHTQIGGDLLSQALAGQVPSALRGLTALFGMGRGVSPSLWPPKGCETGGPPPSPQNRTADRLKAGIKISVQPPKH